MRFGRITHDYSVQYFLIRKHKYVELITSQAVFEYIVDGYDTEDTVMDNLRRVRIPSRPRTTSIRDAFELMMRRVFVRWSPQSAEYSTDYDRMEQ